ncbi:putative A-kinase anchor protein 10, mitochondrial [Apostichopus japonicus]|uniref:Putative A-kinase anchor protein 10, mitochondrial n=1 Tax=Stichopus japonicus TaxID=307972 RepID=A0A2G8KI89_STIJA|nr:putative A-kinase anchor protein 10, mitochondrial [Apostichopus japonicus]
MPLFKRKSEKLVQQPVVQVKQHQHHSNSRQHTKKGTIQDGTKPSEDRIGVEDVPGGPQPSMGSTNELQRTLSNEEGKLGDLGTGKLGERKYQVCVRLPLGKCKYQASLFGESSTSNRSRLCKTLPDFLHDNSALPYLIQFMDSFNAVQVLQCWLATESFNKASWSHSLTTTMEIEGKTNIPNDGVVGQEEGRDINRHRRVIRD